MTRRAFGFVVALFVVAFAGEAQAYTPFGTVEHTGRIEDVALTTPAGDALYLGHKTSTVYFILGVFVSDDGYVLGLRSNPKHIGDMPPPNMLAEFQKEGKLPDPAAALSSWLRRLSGGLFAVDRRRASDRPLSLFSLRRPLASARTASPRATLGSADRGAPTQAGCPRGCFNS